jgi:hypothetical protein
MLTLEIATKFQEEHKIFRKILSLTNQETMDSKLENFQENKRL